MAPNPKVIAAYRAMANLGIHESKVKPVLKKLLKLYDKNWELIEEENYRALADAIFEEDENPVYFLLYQLFVIVYQYSGLFYTLLSIVLYHLIGAGAGPEKEKQES